MSKPVAALGLRAVRRYGAEATVQAAMRADALLEEGDLDGRATWKRILDAIERLQVKAPAEVHVLVEAAERAVRHSTQFFPFTQEICKQMEPQARVQIIEMLWEVAYADGVLAPDEDMLLRRIAGLSFVPDRKRGMARLRALEKLAAAR